MDLKKEDRTAVADNKKREKDRARLSIAWRIVQDRKHKEIELQQHRAALDLLHEELRLRHYDLLAKKKDKVEQEFRSRQSIAFRLQSWRQQQIEQEQILAKMKLVAEEDATLRELDRESVRNEKREKDYKDKIDAITNFEFIIC